MVKVTISPSLRRCDSEPFGKPDYQHAVVHTPVDRLVDAEQSHLAHAGRVDSADTELAPGDVEQDRVDGAVAGGEPNRRSLGGDGVGNRPRPGADDRFAVDPQPVTEPAQRHQLLGGEAAVFVGADADEQVAILGHDVGEGPHEFGGGDDVLGALVAVGAEGMPYPAGGLPLLGFDRSKRGVLRSADVVVVVGREGQRLALLGDERPEPLHQNAT
jgi:hypothetical protein